MGGTSHGARRCSVPVAFSVPSLSLSLQAAPVARAVSAACRTLPCGARANCPFVQQLSNLVGASALTINSEPALRIAVLYRATDRDHLFAFVEKCAAGQPAQPPPPERFSGSYIFRFPAGSVPADEPYGTTAGHLDSLAPWGSFSVDLTMSYLAGLPAFVLRLDIVLGGPSRRHGELLFVARLPRRNRHG